MLVHFYSRRDCVRMQRCHLRELLYLRLVRYSTVKHCTPRALGFCVIIKRAQLLSSPDRDACLDGRDAPLRAVVAVLPTLLLTEQSFVDSLDARDDRARLKVHDLPPSFLAHLAPKVRVCDDLLDRSA